jgi:hypothetical protein
VRRGPGRHGWLRRALEPGLLLSRLGTLPALALGGWLVAGYPLLLAGFARPLPALLVAVPVLAVLAVAVRGLPALPRTPWWAVLGTLAVAAAFAALAAARHAEPLVLRRDPAVYALAAGWLARHGGLGVPAALAAAGGPDAGFTAESPGFYLHGDVLQPQFMSGSAMALAPGGWLDGWTGVYLMPAVYAGLALLAVAGLAARLVGPRWAPLAALALGITQPELLTARTTLSEPLAQLLVFGALCLLLDGTAAADPAAGAEPARPGQRPAAVACGLSGLLIGLTMLVRLEGLREVLLLTLVAGWLAGQRRPQWKWLAGGAAAGVCFGVVDALGPSRAYVSDAFYLVRPALVLGTALAGGTGLAVWWVRRHGVPDRYRRRLAAAGGLGTVAAFGFFAVRPALQTAHQRLDMTAPILAGLQRDQHLPVDDTRTYAEQALRWVSWYVSWPVVVLAAAAAAVLVWAVLRGLAGRWALVLPVLLPSTALVLYRPGITPDHPWADRRLVPVLLPTVVLLGVAAVAAVAGRARALAPRLARRLGGRPVCAVAAGVTAAVALGGAAVLVLPAAVASGPLLTARTEAGEVAAVQAACTAFGPGDVALAVDARSRQELVAVLRQVCGVPAFAVPGEPGDQTATIEQVTAVVGRVRAAGGRPVLVAQSAEPLPRLTAAPQRQVLDLSTAEHERLLTRRPAHLVSLTVQIWLAAAG